MLFWILEQIKHWRGGLVLQTLETYREFIGKDDISFVRY